ncbi:MAG: TetR/AcrR family transcriptional regulator [Flavobacteriales bacterium]
MGRKPLPKQRTLDTEVRREWLKKLMPFFTKYGFSSIRMDEMAVQVGVSKATFYKHFISKEDLISSLLKWKIEEISGYMPMLLDSSTGFAERYFKAVEISLIGLGGISNVLLSDLEREYPELHKQLATFQKLNLKVLGEFYTEAKNAGFLKSSVDVKTLLIMEELILLQITDPNYLKQKQITLKDFFVKYLHIRSEAIVADFTPEMRAYFAQLEKKLHV